jgi:hypothetical protein
MLKALSSLASGFLGNWQAYISIFAAGLIAGSLTVWRVESWREQAHTAQAAQATVRLVTRQSQINVELGNVVLPALAKIADDKAKHVEEIHERITPKIDAEYPVPLSFVRVWNGESGGPIPPASAGSDASPSGETLSSVASAHAGDISSIDQCNVELSTWWKWYDENKALFERMK